MLRLIVIFCTLAPIAFSQNLPAFRWIQEVDGSGLDTLAGLRTDTLGNIYIAGSTKSPNFPVLSGVQTQLASPGSSDIFVTKLDPDGNIVYSTYFGGGRDEQATAMTVDKNGNVYVTGTTSSSDFPTTSGALIPAAPSASVPSLNFLFKLNPDGTIGYSTYTRQAAQSIAVDAGGSVYLAGSSLGTPVSNGYIPVFAFETHVAKFDPSGSKAIYSTAFTGNLAGDAIAVAADGTAYIGGNGVFQVAPDGSIVSSTPAVPLGDVKAISLSADGSVYAVGYPSEQFQSSSGAFLATPAPFRTQAVVKMDSQLHQVQAATLFGGAYGTSVRAMTVDKSGNVYLAGYTAPRGLPTRTPLAEGFGAANNTGFLSELSGDLSTLLFSSYFGDNEVFGVTGVAVGPNGNAVIGGSTSGGIQFGGLSLPTSGNIWVNSLALTEPPALRIDAIDNAASVLDGPLSVGETIAVRGTGFGSDAQLFIGGTIVPALSVSSTQIIAVVPHLIGGATSIHGQSSGATSNQVLVPLAETSPGIFSADGTGAGQGYILNEDGSLNTPVNPAALGSKITLYATGVGPVTFTNSYAVTEFPVVVTIGGLYCNGVAARMGPVAGFPADVYQLTVYVPDPRVLALTNPYLKDFPFPSQSNLVLQLKGVTSQLGLQISHATP